MRYAVQKMGYPALPEETLRKFVGPPLADSMQKYCGMTSAEAKKAITLYREYYTSKGMFENSLYPGLFADISQDFHNNSILTDFSVNP